MAIFRIELITREKVTIECDSYEEAQRRGEKFSAEANEHSHHGEETTFVVVDPEVEKVWK